MYEWTLEDLYPSFESQEFKQDVEAYKALKGKFITNISDDEITKLIKMQLNDGSSWNIKSISVNGSDAMDYVYSYKKTKLYVMKPDEKTVLNAKNNIKRILDEN